MITCKELTAVLDDYLDGSLPPDQRQTLDEHLAVCPACVRFLEQYRRSIELGKRSFADGSLTDSTAVPDGVLKAIIAIRPNPE